MVTEPDPSDERLNICLIPSRSCTASSIRIVTPCSTSSGVAPRRLTPTLIMSVSKDGNTSSGILLDKLNSPDNNKVTNNKLAATWFLVNQAIMLYLLAWLRDVFLLTLQH